MRLLLVIDFHLLKIFSPWMDFSSKFGSKIAEAEIKTAKTGMKRRRILEKTKAGESLISFYCRKELIIYLKKCETRQVDQNQDHNFSSYTMLQRSLICKNIF